MRTIRTPLACAIALGWLFVTLMILFGGYLMSVDEEWEGWGDVLLNPYLVVSYLAITAGAAVAVCMPSVDDRLEPNAHLRDPGSDSDARR
ncbi:MAG TPA: hypothetical protein VMZ51_01810 [Acidimicrobiales bacterium]|nr:hypothetical protein [Acidimicrobiales bacterium]